MPVGRRVAGASAWLRILLLWVLLSPSMSLSADERRHVFESVSREGDLLQNTVTALLGDRDGMLWVGTQGGLHRYDGQRFLSFAHQPGEPGSLTDDFVTALAEDAEGRLWVATVAGGLLRFDRTDGRFRVQPLPGVGSEGAPGAVTALLAEPDGGLLVATGRGIHRLREGRFETLLAADPEWVPPLEVRGMAMDAGVPLAASNRGLLRLAAAAAPTLLPEGVGTHAVLVDRAGRVWLGGSAGLHRLTDAGAEGVWPTSGSPSDAGEVVTLAEDGNGRIWAGVYGSGLVVFDPRDGSIGRIRHVPRMPGTLPEDSIRSLLVDPGGTLWVGGWVHGLSRVDPRGARFSLLLDTSPERPPIETNNLRGLHEMPDGRLLIGTDGDGLKVHDPREGRFHSLTPVLRTALEASEQSLVLRVYEIRAGHGGYWLASNRGALWLSADLRRAERRLPLARYPEPQMRALHVGADGRVWLGLRHAGLLIHDPATGELTHHRHQPDAVDGLWSNQVMTLYPDRDGRVLVGSLGGINLVEADGRRVHRLPWLTGTGGDGGNLARSFERVGETVYAATHGGLVAIDLGVDPARARYRRWLTADGLPSLILYAVLAAPDGALWLSSNRGVARFDPASGRARAHGLRDGLQGLEFNGDVRLRLADGRLAFGGTAGLNLFDPLLPDAPPRPARVLVSSIRIDHSQWPVFDPGRLERVVLAPGQRLLGLEFAVPGDPDRALEYRLFGESYLALGKQRSLALADLPAGEALLEVRPLGGESLRLALTVQPPFWRSRPMQMAYLLAVLLLAFLAWWRAHRRIAELRAHARALAERDERLRVAVWGSGDSFWDVDLRDGGMHRLSVREGAGAGLLQEWREAGLLSQVHAEDRTRVQAAFERHLAGESPVFESEHRLAASDGAGSWVRVRGRIVARDDDGKPLRLAGTLRSLDATLAMERERRIAHAVIQSMAEAVTVTDLAFRFVAVNPAFERLFGYPAEQVLGRDAGLLDSERHDPGRYAAVRAELEREGHWQGELWQRTSEGRDLLCKVELSRVDDEHGTRLWLAVLADITEAKRAEAELTRMATTDALTGLPNREQAARALSAALATGDETAVLLLDLDRFKHINDAIGHGAGDALLKALGDRLGESGRAVARLGGDEFTVLCPGTGPAAASAEAEALLARMSEPLPVPGVGELVVTASIGIAAAPMHGRDVSALLSAADTAMVRAKARGRNVVQVYDQDLDAKAKRRAAIANALHRAAARGELFLRYQPKHALADGRPVGAEALLRWKSPTLGEVGPAEFIPVAEDSGQIVAIGEWVLREACAERRRWRDQGLTQAELAVNVSALQLFRGDFPGTLERLLGEYGLQPGDLALELTESTLVAHAEPAVAVLDAVRALKVGVAIDDFGTGYSSLSYLRQMPVDKIKIDRAFLAGVGRGDADDGALLASIIDLGHALGLGVVAEGVETPLQRDFLRGRGCDEAQGFLYGPGLSAESLLSRWRQSG